MVPPRATTFDAGFLPYLSKVATDGADVVGHVIATRGWLEPLGHPVLGLGPLGVRPENQRVGVGTALMGLSARNVPIGQRRRTWRWLTDICLPPGSGPPGTGIRLPPMALIRRPRALTSAPVRLRGSFITWVLSLRSGI